MPTTTLPDCLSRLSTHLGFSPQAWQGEAVEYAAGFFRRGHPERDRLRYWIKDGVVRGLAIRGQEVKNGDWLGWADWSGLEDLLLIDTDFATLKFPPALPHLKRLDLSSNAKATALSLPEMPALERLLVTDNEALASLELSPSGYPKVDVMDLGRNAVKALSIQGEYASLQLLSLAENKNLQQLTATAAAPAAAPAAALKTLSLKACPSLLELPESLIVGGQMEGLYANDCRPRNCPKVFLEEENSLGKVKRWFQELGPVEQRVKNRIVKLLLNGNGNVGKSTLWCALGNLNENRCTCDKDHESTHGIELQVRQLSLGDVDFRGWDFGGQEIYQGTHRLFLTDGAVQVLVLDYESEEAAIKGEPVPDRSPSIPETTTTERAYNNNYNQRIGRFFARQKNLGPDSEFLLVQTKRTLDLKKTGKAKRHPAALELEEDHNLPFRYLDALDEKSTDKIEELRRDLVKAAQRLPIYEMPFPPSWLRVREWLAADKELDTSERIRTILKADFQRRVVEEYGVSDDEAVVELLIDFLHAAGDLYYNKKHLKDRLILDLRWALDGMYEPFQRGGFQKRMVESGGEIRTDDLFPPSLPDRELLLEFMESCGMCYPADATMEEGKTPQKYIFPQFLRETPDRMVDRFWKKQNDELCWLAPLPYYDLPAFQALLCELGRKVSDGKIWAKGIFLDLEDLREREPKETQLPDGQLKLEITRTHEEGGSIRLMFDEPETVAWLPSVKSWIDERLPELDWKAPPSWGEKGANQESTFGREGTLVTTANLPDQIGRYRVLFAEAYPMGEKLLEFNSEKERITKRVSDQGRILDITTKTSITRSRFSDVWHMDGLFPHIIHFMGHGGDGGLFFLGNREMPDQVTGADLKKLLEPVADRGDLKVVILNACDTKTVASAVSRLGVYAIGTSGEITQANARGFAGEFYACLMRFSSNPEEAFFKALARPEVEDPTAYHLYFNGQEITK